jgi:hypothetical protein
MAGSVEVSGGVSVVSGHEDGGRDPGTAGMRNVTGDFDVITFPSRDL